MLRPSSTIVERRGLRSVIMSGLESVPHNFNGWDKRKADTAEGLKRQWKADIDRTRTLVQPLYLMSQAPSPSGLLPSRFGSFLTMA